MTGLILFMGGTRKVKPGQFVQIKLAVEVLGLG
jgi:hypothetical protein